MHLLYLENTTSKLIKLNWTIASCKKGKAVHQVSNNQCVVDTLQHQDHSNSSNTSKKIRQNKMFCAFSG